MAATNMPVKLGGFARIMAQEGLLTEMEAGIAQAEAAKRQLPLISYLVRDRNLSALQVAEVASRSFGFPLLDLNALDPEGLPSKLVDARLIKARRVLPLFSRGNNLFVAISDPTDQHALESVQFKVGMSVSPVLVEDDKLDQWIDKIVEMSDAAVTSLAVDEDIDLDIQGDDDAAVTEAPLVEIDDAPIVKYLQKIMLDAINMGASDLHFEPYEKFYRIRYRIDGLLREIARPPMAIKEKMASRIKVISKLDISEKRVPQDGRMRLILSKTRAIDFRISTLPTLHGEKIVMRILDSSNATLDIEALGYDPKQKEALVHAVQRPYGMVLVTGPTGSGKTVSLYSCLNILNQPGINISTAEDPAEINLPGINQVNINDKAGLTFAAALKSFLRQDPDVIMVGEIRDLETADIAIKAAQTGHMVLSTVHTNDAPSTLTRLMNMGVAPFNIASSVILITAQRLARRLCKNCKQALDLPRDALLGAGFKQEDLADDWQLFGPKEGGCEVCNGSGYKGRVGIYQVMPISDEISRIIMKNGSVHDIADQARREGVNDLRQSGLLKVKQGLTSLEEIEAVTNE